MEHDPQASDAHGDDDAVSRDARGDGYGDDELLDVTPLSRHPRAVVPPRRSGNMHGVNEAQRWADFGRFVAERREELSLNRRAAAKKAGLSESTLKALESGYQTAYGGVRVLPNLTPDELQQLADALEIDAVELRGRLGRAAPRLVSNEQPDSRATALARRIARLDERDRQIVELLVQRLANDE
ncbi:MAG: helix-turn-helix transcriptional regulator [Actinobacteria bacterium]|nr:helix-turn-helix transcriptional regulator [Actinomycetota bacterium]